MQAQANTRPLLHLSRNYISGTCIGRPDKLMHTMDPKAALDHQSMHADMQICQDYLERPTMTLPGAKATDFGKNIAKILQKKPAHQVAGL